MYFDMVRVQYLFLGVFQSPAIARCRFSKVLQLPGVRVSKVLQLPGVKFSKVLQLPGVGFFGVKKWGLRNGEVNIETLFAINLIN
jgi:hypothetical protein